MDFSFDAGKLGAEDVARITADMWADLPFDREALAALKRDCLILDGLNLGGTSPYLFTNGTDGAVRVSVATGDTELLLDLWRIHFRRGLRPRNLAA